MSDAAALVSMFGFLGVLVTAFFNYKGARDAEKHELEMLRLKKELEDEDEK